MSSDFNHQLFIKVATLEARLELAEKQLYETTQTLKEVQSLLTQAMNKIDPPTTRPLTHIWE